MSFPSIGILILTTLVGLAFIVFQYFKPSLSKQADEEIKSEEEVCQRQQTVQKKKRHEPGESENASNKTGICFPGESGNARNKWKEDVYVATGAPYDVFYHKKKRWRIECFQSESEALNFLRNLNWSENDSVGIYSGVIIHQSDIIHARYHSHWSDAVQRACGCPMNNCLIEVFEPKTQTPVRLYRIEGGIERKKKQLHLSSEFRFHVFLSHRIKSSRMDAEILYHMLQAQDIQCFWDRNSLTEISLNALKEAIEDSMVFVIILHPEMYTYPEGTPLEKCWCIVELIEAFKLKKTIVPILKINLHSSTEPLKDKWMQMHTEGGDFFKKSVEYLFNFICIRYDQDATPAVKNAQLDEIYKRILTLQK